MNQNQQNDDEMKEFEGDYQHIKKDVKQVLVTNFLIVVLLVALFLVNQKTGFIDHLATHFFK